MRPAKLGRAVLAPPRVPASLRKRRRPDPALSASVDANPRHRREARPMAHVERLRVAIITQDAEAIAAPILRAGFHVVGVVESAPRGFDAGRWWSRARLLRLAGAVIRPAKSLRLLSVRRRLPYLLHHRANHAELAAFIRRLRPDVIVVHSMSQLLRREVFETPRYGTINLHPSLLPAYRGAAPRPWVYLQGADSFGATLHYIDSGEDTGDLIDRREAPLTSGLHYSDYEAEILRLGRGMVLDGLRRLERGESLPRAPQPLKSPTVRARRVTDEELASLIDWRGESVERIWHLLRGNPNWWRLAPGLPASPGLLRRWVLHSQRPHLPGEDEGDLGAVRAAGGGRFVLRCRDGVIELRTRFDARSLIARSSLRRRAPVAPEAPKASRSAA